MFSWKKDYCNQRLFVLSVVDNAFILKFWLERIILINLQYLKFSNNELILKKMLVMHVHTYFRSDIICNGIDVIYIVCMCVYIYTLCVCASAVSVRQKIYEL